MSVQIRKLVARNSSVRVVFRDPEDVSLAKTDALRLLSAANGAVATYQVFDDELAMTLRETATVAAAGVFEVAGPGARKLEVGDRLWLLEDDGTVFNSDVTAIDLSAGTVTTTAAVASDATAGARVRRALTSAPIAMAGFGTPVQANTEWGFADSFNPDLLGLLPLQFHKFSVEAFLKGDSGSDDLNLTQVLLAQFDEVVES